MSYYFENFNYINTIETWCNDIWLIDNGTFLKHFIQERFGKDIHSQTIKHMKYKIDVIDVLIDVFKKNKHKQKYISFINYISSGNKLILIN
jgi:hypothetical protein